MLARNWLGDGSARITALARIFRPAAFVIASLSAAVAFPVATASDQTRTISFFNMHTKEQLTVTYKENGRYVPEAMARINHMLRDWRRNEAIKMNPELIDLVYDVHEKTGSDEPIHVVSGYRSPVTNAALRRRGSGVAKRSQHMLGNAIDLYFPDVSEKRVREVALIHQRGGVGYYPRSGRPFVHVDVGRVRHWPRMSRDQLARLFPDGDTLHIPADGKPLSRRKVRTDTIMVARNDAPVRSAAEEEDDTLPGERDSASIILARAEAPVASADGGSILNILGLGRSGRKNVEPATSGSDNPTLLASVAPQPSAEATPVPLLNPPVPALRPDHGVVLAQASAQPEPPAAQTAGEGAPVPAQRPIVLASADAGPSPSLVTKAQNTGGPLFATGSVKPDAEPDLDAKKGSVVMASLAPAGIGQIGGVARKQHPAAPSAGAIGIWSSGLDYRAPQVQNLVVGERVLGRQFATLSAPEQRNLGSLVHSPGQSLSINFTASRSAATQERFSGSAIKPLRLALASTPFQTASR